MPKTGPSRCWPLFKTQVSSKHAHGLLSSSYGGVIVNSEVKPFFPNDEAVFPRRLTSTVPQFAFDKLPPAPLVLNGIEMAEPTENNAFAAMNLEGRAAMDVNGTPAGAVADGVGGVIDVDAAPAEPAMWSAHANSAWLRPPCSAD